MKEEKKKQKDERYQAGGVIPNTAFEIEDRN